jgi:hypothetical protein
MPELSTPTAPAAAPPDALHIVLFGLPAAGKTSLLGALGESAQAQEHLLHGRLTDLSHGLAELRRRLYEDSARRTAEEVVPYPVDFEPFDDGRPGGGRHLGAVLIDCDGRVANDLLVRRPELPEDSPEGTLAHEVEEADTLVLVLDASAPAAQVDADFVEFDRFLRQMERARGRRTEVGGLPVFLVLTKCDLLAQAGDTAADWMERIEGRKREVDARFRDFLARRGQEAGPSPFGRIDLHLWATAIKRPALVNAPPKAREPYGVAELFRQCLELAAAFRARRRRSARRLLWTVGGATAVVALLVGLTVSLFLRQERLLEQKVEEFRSADLPTPAERLRGPLAELRRKRDYLAGLRDDRAFPSLPPADRQLVDGRLEELQTYLPYLKKVQEAPRPRDARGLREVQEIRDTLEGELALPRADWAQTEAGRLLQERLDEAEGLVRVRTWYLENSARAGKLWTFAGYKSGPDAPGINWRSWAAEVEKVLDLPPAPPFAPEVIPGTDPPLTYDLALRFDLVLEARSEWETKKRLLKQVLDVGSALGLIEPARGRPAVLAIPRDFTLEQARARRQELEKAYPAYQAGFTLADLPDAIRPDVRQAAGTSYDYLLPPARALVLRRLEQVGTGAQETPARWDAVRQWLKDPEELASWRVLATVLARLRDPDADDPVSALASFLGKKTFTIDVRGLTLEVPEDLKVKPAPDAVLSVYHPAGAGEKAALTFEQSGEGRRDAERRLWIYAFRRTEPGRITYRPGDALWATLPLRGGLQFTWARNHSSVYQFERLRRPPRLHKADESNLSGTLEEGVLLMIEPTDGVPGVPDLMPVVRPSGR